MRSTREFLFGHGHYCRNTRPSQHGWSAYQHPATALGAPSVWCRQCRCGWGNTLPAIRNNTTTMLFTDCRVNLLALHRVTKYQAWYKNKIINTISCQLACCATTYQIVNMIRKPYYLRRSASSDLLRNTSPNSKNDTKTVLFTAFRVNWPAVQHLTKYQK